MFYTSVKTLLHIMKNVQHQLCYVQLKTELRSYRDLSCSL